MQKSMALDCIMFYKWLIYFNILKTFKDTLSKNII